MDTALDEAEPVGRSMLSDSLSGPSRPAVMVNDGLSGGSPQAIPHDWTAGLQIGSLLIAGLLSLMLWAAMIELGVAMLHRVVGRF